MMDAKEVILKVSNEFTELTGRKYGLFEEYRTEDADVCMIILNSSAGTGKYVVDELRAQGKKVGLIKPRVFRPLPGKELAEALSKFTAVAVMDKADSFNAAGGPLFTDVTSAMYGNGVLSPKVINYIYGIGGRDVKAEDLEFVFTELLRTAKTGKVDRVYNYLGVREKGVRTNGI